MPFRQRLALSTIVATALLVGCLLMVEVSNTGTPGATSVAQAELATSDSGDLDRHIRANRTASEPILDASVANHLDASPVSSGDGSFTTANLGAMNWSDLEKNLQSLQPVLDYSRRIPVVSSVQSTVDLTLGLIRAKQRENAVPPQAEDANPDYGYLQGRFKNLA